MYIFTITAPGGTQAKVEIDGKWHKSGVALLDGDSEAIEYIASHFKRYGMTPDGRIADFPDIEPMSVHRTLVQAKKHGFSFDVEGEVMAYPNHTDVALDSLQANPGEVLTIHLKGKKLPPLMGRYMFQGLPISVENSAGTFRAGIDPGGKEWKIEMKADYGYIRSTTGKDGDAVDCYVGPDRKAKHAYIVKQHRIEVVSAWGGNQCPECHELAQDCACPGAYDEDKVMLGYQNKQDAIAAYLAHYNNPLFLGPVSTIPVADLSDLLTNYTGKGLPLQFAAALDSLSGPDRILTAKTILELEKAFYAEIYGATSSYHQLLADQAAAEYKEHRRNGYPDPSAAAYSLGLAILGGHTALATDEEADTLFSSAGATRINRASMVSNVDLFDQLAGTETVDAESNYQDLIAFMESDAPSSEKELRSAEYYQSADELRAKRTAAGRKIIKTLLDESPITQEEAEHWADSQILRQGALDALKKSYSGGVEAARLHMAEFYRLTRGALGGVTFDLNTTGRASASVHRSIVNLDDVDFNKRVLFHEMAHPIEHSRVWREAAYQAMYSRRVDDKIYSLREMTGGNYDRDEVAIKDHFANAYMGKMYSSQVTELTSMTIEALSDPERLVRLMETDPVSAGWMFGMLRTINKYDVLFGSAAASVNDPERFENKIIGDLIDAARRLKPKKYAPDIQTFAGVYIHKIGRYYAFSYSPGTSFPKTYVGGRNTVKIALYMFLLDIKGYTAKKYDTYRGTENASMRISGMIAETMARSLKANKNRSMSLSNFLKAYPAEFSTEAQYAKLPEYTPE